MSSEKALGKFSVSRKKFPSVQNRLENARNRPLRPDLEDLLSNQTLEESCEELTQGFNELVLRDDDSENVVDNNQNELHCVQQTEKSPKAMATADELFFRLSRGIRILPEGLPGHRGMVTPLSPNNDELKEQIDKFCIIPKPWIATQLQSLPNCICFRNVLYSRCKKCNYVMKGRVYRNCERHPGIAFLLDFFFCYNCLAETDQLCEL